jgi:hypothetical protein
MQHEPQCPFRMFGADHTDPAKRLADHYNLHRVADLYGAQGRWIAVRLDDGISDGVLYDTKQDAIRHQTWFEFAYAFLPISMRHMNLCDAETYLALHRKFYAKGFRLADPDKRNGGPDIIMRATREDTRSLLGGVASNLYLPGREN